MGIVRTGLHKPLEDAANEILRASLAGVTRHADKSDVLTPWKEQDRRKREVYVSTGAPDASVRRGNFHRGLNPERPHLNSVDAYSPPSSGMARGHGPNAWDNE